MLVIARSTAAAAFLTRAFREKTTRKIYWALVVGVPKPPQGRISLALAKRPGQGGERVRADPDEGKPAVTYYRVVDSVGEPGELACAAAGHRAHPSAAGALRRDRHADPRRRQVWRRRCAPCRARRAHAGFICMRARSSIPHPQGGILRITAPLPPHMRQSWEFFGFPGDVEDPFAGLDLPE